MLKAQNGMNGIQVTVAVTNWLESHKKELTTAKGASERLFADTGVKISPRQLTFFCRKAELDLFHKKASNINDSFTRDAIIAKAVRDLYDNLGADCSLRDELTKIVSRRTPDNPLVKEGGPASTEPPIRKI